MAGKPKEARIVAALTKRAASELGPDSTPLDYVCTFLAGGKMFPDLAASLAAELNEPVSRQLVSGAAHALSADAKERIATARRECAIALVEDTITIADEAQETTGAAAKARLQIGSRQFFAERFNPEQFGTMKPQVSVSIGTLMLEALRQPPPPPPALPALLLSGGSSGDQEP